MPGPVAIACQTCSGESTGALDAFPDGVWLVELAPFSPMDGPDVLCRLVETLISVLGVRDDAADIAGTPADPVRLVSAALAGKQVLLVLDNCEHVVEPVGELALAGGVA